MIDTERMQKNFIDLARFDSVSYEERKIADRLKVCLTELGFDVEEDDAGVRIGGNAGNIHAFRKGTAPGEPVLLSAHMDVVEPGRGKRPQFADSSPGKITSDGTTVLGADDICGIVEILEAVRHVTEEDVPHRDIEILFSVAEEAYSVGADVADYTKIRSSEAYVLDMSGAPGCAAIAAPTILSFEIVLHGKAAHAGFAPETGIHAIRAMADLIGRLQQGHIDEETTLNVGLIEGGTALNIVPEQCVCRGEIRSSIHEKALACARQLQKTLEEVKTDHGIEGTLRTKVYIMAYRTPEDAVPVQRFQKACRTLGLPGDLIETFGGSDNNQFAKYGLSGIVLSCGMYEVHSVHEYTLLADLEKGAQLVAELVKP